MILTEYKKLFGHSCRAESSVNLEANEEGREKKSCKCLISPVASK